MSSTSISMSRLAIGLQLMIFTFVAGQNELFSNPSQIPKTNFHCKGRPAGYYADVEAGCQVYHMCDGLGRQFSYSCPNTTLFQQRMLICDHWYMVNCSKAESDYDANLLIGQRDKPFVRDDEYDVRTPRPDLFDKQYAPDFAGETFRKTISPLLNSIHSFDKHSSVLHKAASSPAASSRWNTVQPPIQTTPFPSTTPRSNFQSFNQFQNGQPTFSSGSDLKTSSSQDSRRTQNENVFETDEKPVQKTTPKPLIIEFQPPFLHPIFNYSDTVSTTTTKSTPQFVRPIPTTSIPPFIQTTVNSIPETRPPVSNEDRFRPRPSSVASSGVSNFGDRLRTSSTPTPTTPTPTPNFVPVLAEEGKIKEPPTVLLPPYETLNLFGSASTQGPPIYREWKLPASNLEPPYDENKSNGAITISSDENQIPVIPPHTTISAVGPSFVNNDLVPPLFESFNNVKLPSISLQPPAYSPLPMFNDTVPSATNHSFPSFSALNVNSFTHSNDKSQTQRSVSSTPTAANSISTKRNSETSTFNYVELKKKFSVPEFTFPLENVERPSYTETNAVNSFQIKIPDEVSQSQEQLVSDGSSNEVQRKPWYGENAKCPECHPSFLKPGTCEPCIKIR
ncbi:mucin-2-like [Sitodiplosis mosellana]|uniref:mucin-2-like n=1 Tax=Sitodiplosis mosellana TaxID=263140 RepID=UPI00244424FC|nr:mucin-2-like [Sitodiplosis mosellana]XP_055301812.1 mucin-2-like [Sitodiplosis mosellana]